MLRSLQAKIRSDQPAYYMFPTLLHHTLEKIVNEGLLQDLKLEEIV